MIEENLLYAALSVERCLEVANAAQPQECREEIPARPVELR